ncbi:MAG: hypothetical protein QM756_45275 [Polyangiaceae bacterium]
MIGRRFAVLSFGLFGAFASACGGDNSQPRPEPQLCRPIVPVSDTPDPGGGPVDCTALDGLEIFEIDRFEPPRTAWYVNSDRTAEQQPVPDKTVESTYLLNGGRCVGVTATAASPTRCSSPRDPRGSCTEALNLESRKGIHVRSGLLTSNGGQLGMDLPKVCSSEVCDKKPGPPEVGVCSPTGVNGDPYSSGLAPSPALKGCHGSVDYSDWDGIVLWARVAPGSAAYLRVRTADGIVDDKGCVCNPYTNQNDSSDGCDKWGTYISIDNTFRAYLIPFSGMQQGGWGYKSKFLDTSDLFSLGIEWGRGAWDLWIDDVAFYRRRP